MKEQSKNKKKDEIEWDKKRIVIFLFIFIFLIFGAYQLKSIIFGDSITPSKETSIKQDVRGVSIQEPPGESFKKSVQEQISNIKEDAQSINVADIASSSPQVQKIINDLKSLQDYPSNQIKDVCQKVCSGL
jgi:hypothetical protein